MSSSLHYKFRAAVDFKLLEFEGLSISVSDCKREICAKENIKAESFDLLLQNNHTKRTYTADELIPRNSSILVQRVPRENAEKLPKIQSATSGMVGKTTTSQPAPAAGVAGHVDTETFDSLSEEQRLAHVKDVSARAYTPANYQKRTNQIMSGPPPPTYTCNRCYQPGHWYKNCPMLNTKRTTGIPGDELMETTADDPMAMITGSGKYVVPIMHWRARNSKRPDADEIPLSMRTVPPELKCEICHELLKEAMLTPCCGESFCAECISNRLMEKTECPHCSKEGVGVDQLIPNKSVRLAVESWASQSSSSNVAGFAEKSQPLPPDRRARARLRIGIGTGGTTPQSEMDAEGGNTPGQESEEAVHPSQRMLQQPLPPGLDVGAAAALAVPAATVAATVSPAAGAPTDAPAAVSTSSDGVAAAAAAPTMVAVPVAAFQPHLPPPPLPPQGGTVLLIDPITQQPIFNPHLGATSQPLIPPTGEVYQASSLQLKEAWEEYKNREKEGKKKEKEEKKKKKKRSRSRSRSASSYSSSSSSSSSSSDSDRDRRKRRTDDYRTRSTYWRGAPRGGRGYRGRAGFHSGFPPRTGMPPGAVMVMGPDGIPRYTIPYAPGMYGAPAQPTSLLEGGDIVPPDGVVYLDAFGQMIPGRAVLPMDGRDPRDSRPPAPSYRGGGYRGRGRGNYDRDGDKRWREGDDRRRYRDTRDSRDSRYDDRRDRDRDGRYREEKDGRRRHEDDDRERDDDRYRKRERRERSEERRREEEEIEATIKALEEQMCEGKLAKRSDDRRREDREGRREEKEERRDRREEKEERRKRKKERHDEKENDKHRSSPDSNDEKKRRVEDEERKEEREITEGEERVEKEDKREGEDERGEEGHDEEASHHKEKKAKKHKKHKKEKKSKKEKKEKKDKSDDESPKEGKEEGEGKELKEGEEEIKEKKHKHKKAKKEKKEKKKKREREMEESEDEKKREEKKRKKVSQEERGSQLEDDGMEGRKGEKEERRSDGEDEERRRSGEKEKGKNVDIGQVFQQAPILPKKITLHLSK